MITEGIIIHCKTEGCSNTFRFVPRLKFNSTIKDKAPLYCRTCENKLKFEHTKATAIQKPVSAKKQAQKPLNRFNLSKQIKPNLSVTDKIPSVKTQLKQVWYNKPRNLLIEHVQRHLCNRYIRWRDAHMGCISCGGKVEEAGHFKDISAYPELRLMIENIHGQCHCCNTHLDGNKEKYTVGLINRYGQSYVNRVESLVKKQSLLKDTRFDIIEIGFTFHHLLKNKIRIYTSVEFDHYRNLIKTTIKL